MGKPDISIITPSLNMLEYLKRCCASVADQAGPPHEHIIVDACSTDGTVDWLGTQKGIRQMIEADNGMYDALNKGLKLAQGDVLSYLNCDEQYLPGTLQYVRKFFGQHSEIDILFGDFLLVRPDGNLLSYRKAFAPRWVYFSSVHLYLFTCTMFLRRRIVDAGYLFDATYRSVADEELVVRLLKSGFKAAHVNQYFSAFTLTGKNQSRTAASLVERRQMRRSVPLWVRLCKYPLALTRYVEKFAHGAYRQKMPLEYEVYIDVETGERKHFCVRDASWRWPKGY
jgi:glycosyltransferase involved in cell wall biosynthesis